MKSYWNLLRLTIRQYNTLPTCWLGRISRMALKLCTLGEYCTLPGPDGWRDGWSGRGECLVMMKKSSCALVIECRKPPRALFTITMGSLYWHAITSEASLSRSFRLSSFFYSPLHHTNEPITEVTTVQTTTTTSPPQALWRMGGGYALSIKKKYHGSLRSCIHKCNKMCWIMLYPSLNNAWKFLEEEENLCTKRLSGTFMNLVAGLRQLIALKLSQ